MTRFLDRLLPPELTRDPDDARRGRLFVVMAMVLSLAAFFFAWQSGMQDEQFIGSVDTILAVGGVISLANIPLAWLTRSVRLPAGVACGELILVVWAAGFFGAGVGDPSQWFLLIAPLLATFLIGPRAGFVTAGGGAVAVLVTFIAAQAGATFLPPGPDDPRIHVLGATVVLFTVAAFSALYESSRVQGVLLVERAMAELRGKNAELEGLARTIAEARDRAVEESARKTGFLLRMQTFGAEQGRAIERTRQASAQLADTLRAISASVETLATSSHASDASVAGMSDTAVRVSQAVHALVTGLGDTERALGALTRSVALVEQQTHALRTSAETTARAMLEMEQSAERVEQNARRTVELSDQMIKDAERGQAAVRRTLQGVDGIRASARTAGDVIRSLDKRVAAIGAMNKVIDEVAVETNVLALNAAIIAAQVGERGHGFAVVADQIKGLAARTARSTREISSVVRAVQDEAENAVAVIAAGEQAAEAGVALSDEAARALELIVASAQQATEEVRGIEQATVAQARSARDVGAAMAEVTHLLAEAVKATTAQGQSVRLIEEAMARLGTLAPDLEARSQQQTEGARLARAAIARIKEMALTLSSVQGDQSRASQQTLRAVEEIQHIQRGQDDALRSLA